MSQLHLDHRKGLLITGLGGLILSADIPLLRLGEGETWSTLLLRSGTTFISAFVIWAVWSLATGRARTIVPGPRRVFGRGSLRPRLDLLHDRGLQYEDG